MGDGYDIWDAVDDLLAVIVDQRPVEEVMAWSIGVCERRRENAIWDELRQLRYAADVRRSQKWWKRLLKQEAPGDDINGFWFGIYNPCSDSSMSDVRSAFYASGSSSWPEQDWPCETTWWPEGHYPDSPIMTDLYRKTASTDDDSIAYYGDYFLTLAYTGATVVDVINHTPLDALVGNTQGRCIAFGHDSGDFLGIGTITRDGVKWSVQS